MTTLSFPTVPRYSWPLFYPAIDQFVSHLRDITQMRGAREPTLKLVFDPSLTQFVYPDTKTTQVFFGDSLEFFFSLNFSSKDPGLAFLTGPGLLTQLQLQPFQTKFSVTGRSLEARITASTQNSSGAFFLYHLEEAAPLLAQGDCITWAGRETPQPRGSRVEGLVLGFCLKPPPRTPFSQVCIGNDIYITPYGRGVTKDKIRACEILDTWPHTDSSKLPQNPDSLDVLIAVYDFFGAIVTINDYELRRFLRLHGYDAEQIDNIVKNIEQELVPPGYILPEISGDATLLRPSPAFISLIS